MSGTEFGTGIGFAGLREGYEIDFIDSGGRVKKIYD
jgi:hypothetical protein